jgi:DNA processing protein
MALGDERAAYVALALTRGIGANRMTALLATCETASGALSAPFAFLCTIPGISPAAATAIKETSPEIGAAAMATTRELGGQCLVPEDVGWPEALREIPDPPTLLFAAGDPELLSRPGVAIVGSRDHSLYGAECCRAIAAAAAAAGIVVVSGMARGLDAVAHSAALDAEGQSIGILGNGLGVIYPAANRLLYQRMGERGLLLTEFPPGERPGVGAFPRRNRLISALARVTVVIEAAEGSGTLITVGTALTQGKDVMAVPGNIISPTSIGTNRLIRDGAEPLLEIADLLAHYPESGTSFVPLPARDEPPPLPADLLPLELQIYEALRSQSLPVDDLVTRFGSPASEILVTLSALEIRGLVGEESGRLKALSPARR